MAFLNLIRYQNLIIIALMQVFIKYGLLEALEVQLTLSNFQFGILVFATLCIAAGGNIINDIYDIEIDRINKPKRLIVGKKITEKSANYLYIIFNVLGVCAGFYLANSVGKSVFASIFVLISALLYLYSTYLKGILLVGNLVVSGLVASSIIIVGVFDLIPAIQPNEIDLQMRLFKIIIHYALFALFINFIRELVKDLQDINGDKNGGLNTLPIAFGRKRATFISFVLGVLLILTVVAYLYFYLYNYQEIVLYFLFLIVAPLLYFCTKAWVAETNKDYAFLSILLKVIMFLGMCSILFYKFVLL